MGDDYVNLVKMDSEHGVPVRKFELNCMEKNATICMIAKRGSGKSWVVRDIVCHLRKKVPGGVVLAPTDKVTNFYGEFIPDVYIHYEFQTEILERVLRRQSKIIEKYKEKMANGKKINPKCFIIMDDCLANAKQWIKDESIKELLFNGRHYQITYILTMQFPLGIPPDYRQNLDYVFLLADDNTINKKKLYENYCGMFRTFDIFSRVFNVLTKDFSCLVINNRGVRNNILEKIFWYKAGNSKKKFGCKQYVEFSENNYNENWNKIKEDKNYDDYLYENRKNKKIFISKVN